MGCGLCVKTYNTRLVSVHFFCISVGDRRSIQLADETWLSEFGGLDVGWILESPYLFR